MLSYPQNVQLKEEIDACCKKYGIEKKGLLQTRELNHLEFSNQMRLIFLKKMMILLKGFDFALLNPKNNNFELFRREYVKSHEGKKEEEQFMEDFSNCGSFAWLYDEACTDEQRNYARIQAMIGKGKPPQVDIVHIRLTLTPNLILKSLYKLSDMPNCNIIEEEKSTITLKKKFNWRKEVAKMKLGGAILDKSGDFRSSKIKLLSSKKQPKSLRRSDSLTSQKTMGVNTKNSYINEEIEMQVEELKEIKPQNLEDTQKSYNTRKKALIYGKKGILAFFEDFISTQSVPTIRNNIIGEEIRSTLDALRNSVSKTQSTLASEKMQSPLGKQDNIDTYSEGSFEDTQNALQTSALVESLIDIRDFNGKTSLVNRESQNLYFSYSPSVQFFLYCAFFYYKHDRALANTAKAFTEAFKIVQNSPLFSSYFPIFQYKNLIQLIDLEELRKVVTPAECKILKHDLAVWLKNPAFDSPTIILTDRLEDFSRPYVNNYKAINKVLNPNPAIIIACALRDLLTLLDYHSSKGTYMFIATFKSPEFTLIEKQAATLRMKNIFIREQKKMEVNYWLDTESLQLSFFINLYNFLVLFALCKNQKKGQPKTQSEWVHFLQTSAIKVGNQTLTAFEIEHAILRASMCPPTFTVGKKEPPINFPKFLPSDPRGKFAYSKCEPLLNFALSLPIK